MLIHFVHQALTRLALRPIIWGGHKMELELRMTAGPELVDLVNSTLILPYTEDDGFISEETQAVCQEIISELNSGNVTLRAYRGDRDMIWRSKRLYVEIRNYELVKLAYAPINGELFVYWWEKLRFKRAQFFTYFVLRLLLQWLQLMGIKKEI